MDFDDSKNPCFFLTIRRRKGVDYRTKFTVLRSGEVNIKLVLTEQSLGYI